MEVNKAGNRRGLHWKKKREAAQAQSAPETKAENEDMPDDAIDAGTNGNAKENLGNPDAGNAREPDTDSERKTASADSSPTLETYRLDAEVPEVESAREHIIAEDTVETERLESEAPKTNAEPLKIDPVSVRIAVDTTSAVAAKIPPDKEKLSDDERALWSSIWEHTFQRLGYASLPLWLEWVAGITTSFIPRFVSWKNWKVKQEKDAQNPSNDYATPDDETEPKPGTQNGNGFAAKLSGLYDFFGGGD